MSIIDNFEAMLAQGKENALLHFSLANEYLKADVAAKAVEHLERALQLDPAYSAAWKLYGKALASSGQLAQAISAYDKGIMAAESKGDIQAAKEMKVFKKRVEKQLSAGDKD